MPNAAKNAAHDSDARARPRRLNRFIVRPPAPPCATSRPRPFIGAASPAPRPRIARREIAPGKSRDPRAPRQRRPPARGTRRGRGARVRRSRRAHPRAPAGDRSRATPPCSGPAPRAARRAPPATRGSTRRRQHQAVEAHQRIGVAAEAQQRLDARGVGLRRQRAAAAEAPRVLVERGQRRRRIVVLAQLAQREREQPRLLGEPRRTATAEAARRGRRRCGRRRLVDGDVGTRRAVGRDAPALAGRGTRRRRGHRALAGSRDRGDCVRRPVRPAPPAAPRPPPARAGARGRCTGRAAACTDHPRRDAGADSGQRNGAPPRTARPPPASPPAPAPPAPGARPRGAGARSRRSRARTAASWVSLIGSRTSLAAAARPRALRRRRAVERGPGPAHRGAVGRAPAVQRAQERRSHSVASSNSPSIAVELARNNDRARCRRTQIGRELDPGQPGDLLARQAFELEEDQQAAIFLAQPIQRAIDRLARLLALQLLERRQAAESARSTLRRRRARGDASSGARDPAAAAPRPRAR